MADNEMSHKPKLEKAAAKVAAAEPKTASMLVTFFVNTFLPILPLLLTQAVPKILKNAKLIAVMREVDKVIDSILEQVPPPA